MRGMRWARPPEAGKFTWRATNEWLHGTHSRSSVAGYFGLGEEHEHKASFGFESDHPLVFAAEGQRSDTGRDRSGGLGELPDGGRRRRGPRTGTFSFVR